MFLPMSPVGGYTTLFSSCQQKRFQESRHFDFDIPPIRVIKAVQPRADVTLLIPSNVWIAELGLWKLKIWGVPTEHANTLSFLICQAFGKTSTGSEVSQKKVSDLFSMKVRQNNLIPSRALVVFKQKGITLPVNHAQRHQSPRASVAAHEKRILVSWKFPLKPLSPWAWTQLVLSLVYKSSWPNCSRWER